MNLTPLEELKQNPDSKPFKVCDIETMNWTTFLCIGLYDGTHYEYFLDLRDFLAAVFSFEEKKQTIYAHFGGIFDFMFILEAAFQIPSLSVENLIPRGSGLLCFDVVEYDEYGDETQRVHFTDSSALLPFGLKSLCENFKVKHNKLDWDHEKTTGVTPELLNYMKIDCKGLYEVIEKYREWPLIKKAGAKSTMASQALQVLRLSLEKTVWSLSGSKVRDTEDAPDQFVRDCYVGGRVEVFKPFVPEGVSLFCADVNSLYPYIMQTTEMPNRFHCYTHKYDPDSHGFYDAVFEVPKMHIPPLGTKAIVSGVRIDEDTGKLVKYKAIKFIFPTGIVKGRWSTIEIEYAKSLGCKLISTGIGIKFHNGGKMFKKYIDELYEIRKTSQRDSVDNIIAKLLMNSCYGRMGLQRERNNLIVDDGRPGREEYAEIKLPGGYVKLMCDPTYLHSAFSNVSIAAWVTSASRIHMHKIYMKYEQDVRYTDTDSLFITKRIDDSDELGELKLEYESDEGACFLLPKTYFIDGIKNKKFTRKIVMKGFDKKATASLNFMDFKLALEGDLSRLKAQMPAKFSTFKTAIRKGKFVALREGYYRKIISAYDKRIIFKDNGLYTSRARHLEESANVC